MLSPAKVRAEPHKARPSVNEAPVTKVMEPKAMMLPWKAVPIPSVTSVPTAQNTLEAWAPWAKTTELEVAVVMADPT